MGMEFTRRSRHRGESRSRGRLRSRPVRVGLAVLAVLAVLVGVLGFGDRASTPPDTAEPVVRLTGPTPAPQGWVPSAWRPFLASLSWNRSAFDRLAVLPSDVADPVGAKRIAAGAVGAQVLADPAARVGYERYLADPFAGRATGLELDPAQEHRGACHDLDVAATAVASLPWDPTVAKALVLWSGDCIDGLTASTLAGATRDPSLYQASMVYLARQGDGWRPLRVTELPGSAAGRQDSGAVTPAYLLGPLRCPGQRGRIGRARVEVVEAAAALCRAARAAGVPLAISSGLRSAADQRARGTGDTTEATAEVAWRDGRCASRHCSGWALDVRGAGVRTWLGQTVACELASGAVTPAGTCPPGARPVPRALSYGFAQPFAWAWTHLEYVLPPTMPRWSASCDPAPSLPVPTIIATVWRCRLGEAGLSRELVREAVARGLVVSRCLSGWNVGLVTTSPAGRAVGVFQLRATELPSGSRGARTDPRVSADAAARRFLAAARQGQDGFASWPACAARLPGAAGGMPAWAYAW